MPSPAQGTPWGKATLSLEADQGRSCGLLCLCQARAWHHSTQGSTCPGTLGYGFRPLSLWDAPGSSWEQAALPAQRPCTPFPEAAGQWLCTLTRRVPCDELCLCTEVLRS